MDDNENITTVSAEESIEERSPVADPTLTDDDRVDDAGDESFPASDAPEGRTGKDVRPR